MVTYWEDMECIKKQLIVYSGSVEIVDFVAIVDVGSHISAEEQSCL